jgi:serpin B
LAGAKGATATEMQKVLHAPKGGAEGLAKALGVHQRLMNQRAGADNTLRVANAIWTSPDCKFDANYILNVGAAYGGGFHRIDFASDAEQARGVINGWVGEQTNDMIPELLPQGVITAITKAILCNALYFQGTWQHQFDADDTKPRRFWAAKERAVQVPTMYRKGKIRLAQVEGAQLGAMAYEGDTLSMVVVLPGERDGLDALEQRLDAAPSGRPARRRRSTARSRRWA